MSTLKNKGAKIITSIIPQDDYNRITEKGAFSNKPFGQTSSIVLANIATWVLSTHVAIRGRDSPI
ncbi:hypothetical protein [Saccharolobus islandicus]|uniref:hypothetical protein n=1 Tax=Saccharolobus islandicus TaxID=43080 RepID=UPI000360DFF8|nr:hypothetical protein [Sulfolobus islandicus]